ncbi:MAG: hypothetical protein ACPGO3_05325 [Magnetospiraceae bacterium]
MSESINSVNLAAEDAGSASSKVLEASTELARNAKTLQQDVRKFLDQVRAG